MWVNPPTGSWMTVDDELPQRVRQTIGATISMLTIFFNPKEFTIVDLSPQDTSFIAVYFVNNAILPLTNRMLSSWGYRPSQVASAFRQFQAPHYSACPRTDG
jgi:hypothetical protein